MVPNNRIEFFIALFLGAMILTMKVSIALGNVFLGLAVAAALYYVYQNRKGIKQIKEAIPFERYYLIFSGLILFSVLFSPDIKGSLTFFGGVYIWRYVLFLLIVYCLHSKKYLVNLLITIFISAGIDSCMSAYQVIVGGEARGIGLGSSGVVVLALAGILVMLLPVIFIATADKRVEPRLRMAALGTSLLVLGGLVFNNSRSAWLIAGLNVLVLSIGYIKRSWKAIMAILLVVFIASGVAVTQTNLKERTQAMSNMKIERSSGDRVEVWKSSVLMIQDYPVVGVGLDQFKSVYLPLYRSKAEFQGLPHAHNNFLQMGVETGAIGLLGFVIFVFGSLITAFKKWYYTRNPYNLMLACVIMNYLVLFGLIEYSWGNSLGMKVFWMLLGILIKLAYTTEVENDLVFHEKKVKT